MLMDWHRGRSTVSDKAWGTVEENRASSMSENKMSVPTEWSVWIDRTWGGVFEVLGTWDDKLSGFLEKRSIRIR
jgi:hypothetical protein